jgi:hypothetical protein
VRKALPTLLQVLLVLTGLAALAFMLGMPHLEGRNAHATAGEVYFNDPFLAYAYLASLPFFIALYQAFKALGYFRQDQAVSQGTVRALRTIKTCALALIAFTALGLVFIVLGESDDRAGGVFMGFLVAFGSAFVATAAAKYERIFRNAVDLKTRD